MRGPLEHDKGLSSQRPPVPGKAIEYVYLPARGFMTARVAKRGQVMRIIDPEGQQVADCIIWDASNLYNVLNASNTRMILHRWGKYQVGHGLYSKNADKLVTISEDTTDGAHSFGGGFCNEPVNRFRYGIPGTINCRDNLVSAMAQYGFSVEDIDWGSCIAFFMNVEYNPDGTAEICEPHTKPGDHIDLLAEMDIIVAISNCPSERNPCNAYNPTPLQVVIFKPNEDYLAKFGALSKSAR